MWHTHKAVKTRVAGTPNRITGPMDLSTAYRASKKLKDSNNKKWNRRSNYRYSASSSYRNRDSQLSATYVHLLEIITVAKPVIVADPVPAKLAVL